MITNITFPPNKTLGNFVPTKPCLIGLEQNWNYIFFILANAHLFSNLVRHFGNVW
jgi:hypothetical protein